MRVVVLGGVARSLVNFRGPLLKEMVERGHEVFACAPDAPEEVRSQLSQIGVIYRDVPIARAGLNPLRDIGTGLTLFRLFRSLQPDAVLAYTAKPVIWGCIAARLARVQSSYAMITGLGYTFMDGGNLKQRMVQRIVCGLYRTVLSRPKAVFFQNPDDMAEFQSRGLVRKNNQTVLINGSGVDTDYFSPTPLPKTPTFLLMARLIGDKGIREYREAARWVRTKYPQARFLLAGGFDQNPAAISQEEIRQWQEEGDIEYLGNLEDVRHALSQSLVYVLPSYYREGTPRTILEAMSMGRPIITTDAPGCRETVQFVRGQKSEVRSQRLESSCHQAKVENRTAKDAGSEEAYGTIKQGENGFLVPVRDADALATAMEKFIEQPDLAQSMGRESRQIAEEKYDVYKVNQVILESLGIYLSEVSEVSLTARKK